jgi:hypothetical protein
LDWLTAGSTIEVGLKSSATVILLNGHRYELGPGAKATVTAESLAGKKGPVQQLEPPLPPIPKAVPIAGNFPIIGTVVIRGSNIRGLYPRNRVAVLPASAKLSFQGVADASSYQVELVGEDENVLLDLRTESTDIVIPDGTVQVGKHYAWSVEALGPAGAIARNSAEFVTISGEDLERRAEFAKTTEGGADKALALALLADVDFRLGLLREARDGFLAALRLKPDETAIQHALDLVQSALASEPGK